MSRNAGDINFFRGYASLDLLPAQEIVQATTDLLSPKSRDYDTDPQNLHPLVYGSDEGAHWVRSAICHFSNEAFQLDAASSSKPEFLNLTSGASYGILNLLAQTTLPHTGFTRQAFIVSPTYFLINEAFIDAGFGGKICAVTETDQDAVDVAFLQEQLELFDQKHATEDHTADPALVNAPDATIPKKLFRYVLYLIPTYSNPSGKTYSIECRQRLIELARKHDMLIISDDVYDLLVYDQPLDKAPKPVPRMTFLDRASLSKGYNGYGNTISNCTFSKILAPGLRFGYQESVNKRLVAQLSRGGANASGGTPSQLNSMIVGTMLNNGVCLTVLEKLRTVYKRRADILYESIKQWLPAKTIYERQTGGYFSWCTLPDGYDAREISAILLNQQGIVVPDGSWFEVVGDSKNWGARCFRISISFVHDATIKEGIQKWGNVCREYATEHSLEF
ncbi:LAMI_0H12112g1_1 [Lachancea mirantina]|uniref:LAMI_0H12112g1_1 n=1 Tax=Lachancea mirantina TaxID=1230905 RepID=A0A1G4KHG8_9SACH|nr:LAMI_0H12112g1_1 [Lachancea mirantina]